MRSILIVSSLTLLFLSTACQKCKECSYSYVKIETIQTINGEEEIVTQEGGWVNDEQGRSFKQECIKNNEVFTIVDTYELEKKNTNKLDFEYNCTDL